MGRWKPLKLPRVGAFKVDTLCNEVPFPHRVLHRDAKIRERAKRRNSNSGSRLQASGRS